MDSSPLDNQERRAEVLVQGFIVEASSHFVNGLPTCMHRVSACSGTIV